MPTDIPIKCIHKYILIDLHDLWNHNLQIQHDYTSL
jgi:hypothetical protein